MLLISCTTKCVIDHLGHQSSLVYGLYWFLCNILDVSVALIASLCTWDSEHVQPRWMYSDGNNGNSYVMHMHI